ncbi:MAG TPA: RsmB/NOP family class I SAM-dependent RNA methyltransferase [Candidatus Deferrimicrobium sp.]|nr:RsmB/NOP family class I SAM-dependent RNA methyltransferase [Candidatus Deferrimicrobium sp.]
MQPDFEHLEEKYKFSKEIIKLFWEKYGQRTEKIIQALKRPCNKYAIRVNTLKTNSDEVIKILLSMNIQAEVHPKLEEVVELPVKGPFTIPEYKKKVVVDKFTAESLIQGADLFAPGIIRTSKIRVGEKVTITAKSGEILASGIAQMIARDMLELKQGLAVKITDSIYQIFSIRESSLFRQGYIFDQSFPSMVVSRVLDPQPNENVLDICAAPGGKATHLAQLMQNKGQILAIDRSKPRIKRLEEHITRLGIKNIKILWADSRNLPEEYLEWADKVLVDPPCSALGVRPKLSQITKDIINLVHYQRQFLKAAMTYVKPGGFIVYSTCTLTTEENEANIQYLLENNNCEIVEQSYCYGSPGEKLKNLKNWQKLQRFYPDLHETPGYFIAKIQKRL